ncbi:hypothetical protein AZA_21732 [Nitrospirillum viridazoti Y2]|nr:hypothetical protein AZA_21732 [Nitrospirillum amazonense Y2]
MDELLHTADVAGIFGQPGGAQAAGAGKQRGYPRRTTAAALTLRGLTAHQSVFTFTAFPR